MSEYITLIGAIIVGLVAVFFGKKAVKDSKRVFAPTPPKNDAANAARDNVQQTFDEEVSTVKKAVTSGDPATALADLGNARSRR
jgi:hypothetical protein